jgi:hypothetical protein
MGIQYKKVDNSHEQQRLLWRNSKKQSNILFFLE